MSSYIDHHGEPGIEGVDPRDVTHSWGAFTEARLSWLYGDRHAIERRAATGADIASWNRLGAGRAAA